MRITQIRVWATNVPLHRPVGISTKTVDSRDHTIVQIDTDEGISGLGYTWGYRSSGVTAECIIQLLSPILLGEDPRETEAHWESMFSRTTQAGRKGLVIRAISAVDIALWDIKAKAVEAPIYRVLGGAARDTPVYASGGYYSTGKSLKDLAEEMTVYVEQGYQAVKMKIGGASLREDIERVRTVRAAIGDNIDLMLDANGAWRDPVEALRACRALESYSPYWIEEPLPPDQYTASAVVAAETDIPIAGGEQEFTRWGFAQLAQSKAVDVMQPNATVAGGITEWMKIAALASSLGIALAPHANPYVHCHLASAFPQAMTIEYFEPAQSIKVLDRLLLDVPKTRNGTLRPTERPGLGLSLNEEALAQFRVAEWNAKG